VKQRTARIWEETYRILKAKKKESGLPIVILIKMAVDALFKKEKNV
jgi:hypothetical protein